jgi:hypothetical protein
VELRVQVVGLHIVEDEHGRHRTGELSEGVEDVLGLERDAGFEVVVVDPGASTDASGS